MSKSIFWCTIPYFNRATVDFCARVHQILHHTLKTSMLVEDGDSILKYLQRVFLPEIKFAGVIQSASSSWWETTNFIMNCNGSYFSGVRSKLLTFSLRRLSTSSFILNFSEFMHGMYWRYSLRIMQIYLIV